MRSFRINNLVGIFALLSSATNADGTSSSIAQVDSQINSNDDVFHDPSSASVLPRGAAPWPCPYYDSKTFSDQASIQYTIYCDVLLLGSIINTVSRSDMDMWQCLSECDPNAACKAVTLEPGHCNLHNDYWMHKFLSTGNIAAIRVVSASPAVPEPATTSDELPPAATSPQPAATSDELPPAVTLSTMTSMGADRTEPPPRAPTTIKYGTEYDTGGV
jgi:hypothetical protein